jgi:hypothetical protein
MKFHPILLLLPLPMTNCIYALSYGLHIFYLTQLAIIITSILYWTNPTNNKYRLLDIAVVNTGFFIHYTQCYYYGFINPAITISFSVIPYIYSHIYDNTFYHAFTWIIGYSSNYYLIGLIAEKYYS